MRKEISNNKGQALIEFILIIPIFIFIIMAMVDIGNIIYKKYNLGNTLDTVVELYEQGDSEKMTAFTNLENVDIDITSLGSDLTKITISKSINIITPGLSNVLGSNYILSVDRTIYSIEEHIVNEG